MQTLTAKQVPALLRRGESETVEFKKGFDRETIETLSAFANTRGGRVFVGVSDTGQVLGVDFGKETIQNWINQVKLSTANALIPDAEILSIKKKSVAVLTVTEYPIKPISCRGRYFKRVNNANHQMSLSEVVNAHLRTFNASWDSYVDEMHTESDLSLEKVHSFIERINRTREVAVLEDPLTVLQKFELLREGRITRAAFLLFMTGESSLSAIELGRFQTSTLIKDGARLKTDLFSEVDGVMAFIRKHISKAYIISGEPQREERWEYPLEALREMVINAIVHRDYASSSDSIVKIFDDHIEIFNPGRLPEGLSVDRLLAGDYVSSIRNRKIADMFKEVGLIEKYGTGIRRIRQGFADYGLPEPKFEEIGGGFRVTSYKSMDSVEKATQVTTQVTTQVDENIFKLLQACKEPATLTELMHRMGLRSRNHFRLAILGAAIKNNLIELTIPDKPRSRMQRYRLTARGKSVLEQTKHRQA